MSKTTITVNSPSVSSNIVYMGKMKPFQIGRIVKTPIPAYLGHIVMRTAAINEFEVMSLSTPNPDCYWSEGGDIFVELLDVELIVNIKGACND